MILPGVNIGLPHVMPPVYNYSQPSRVGTYDIFRYDMTVKPPRNADALSSPRHRDMTEPARDMIIIVAGQYRGRYFMPTAAMRHFWGKRHYLDNAGIDDKDVGRAPSRRLAIGPWGELTSRTAGRVIARGSGADFGRAHAPGRHRHGNRSLEYYYSMPPRCGEDRRRQLSIIRSDFFIISAIRTGY